LLVEDETIKIVYENLEIDYLKKEQQQGADFVKFLFFLYGHLRTTSEKTKTARLLFRTSGSFQDPLLKKQYFFCDRQNILCKVQKQLVCGNRVKCRGLQEPAVGTTTQPNDTSWFSGLVLSVKPLLISSDINSSPNMYEEVRLPKGFVISFLGSINHNF